MTRYLVGSTDPLTLSILRWGIGFVCVLPVALALRVRWPARADWPGVALLGFAPAPFPRTQRPAADPADGLAGTWEFVLWENDGERDRGREQAYQIEVAKDRFDMLAKNERVTDLTFIMRLNPKARPPSFTWSRANRVRYVGSYRLEKDRLQMILTQGSRLADRPTDFGGQAEIRLILRRVSR